MADGTNNEQEMMKKKNREMLPPPGVETTSRAHGQVKKKARFQSTPSSSDDLVVMATAARDATEEGADDTVVVDAIINHEQEHEGPEEGIIEGHDWDEAVLNEKIKSYVELRGYPGIPDFDNDEAWTFKDGQQLNDMNIRLAICRIKAHKMLKGEELMSDAELRQMYPLSILEDHDYFEWFEHDFEWYFHPDYRDYAYFQDYQLLVLRDTAGEYMEWDIYHGAFSTLESDQEFIQFWEKLSSKTEWIKNFLGMDSSEARRMKSLAFYHALKIGQEFTNIFSTLDYMYSVRFDNTRYKDYAFLYFEIWKLVAKQKMNFNEALFQVKDKGISPLCLHVVEVEIEIIRDQMIFHGLITSNYNTYVSNIDENLPDGEAYKLVMEAVKKFVPKRKTYYDYAKKKLDIAEKIGPTCQNSSEVTE